MFGSSWPHKSVTNRARQRIVRHRTFREFILAAVACVLLLGAYHPRVTIAQRPDLEVAFAEKADKLLKQVRRALIADREAVARGKFDRQKSKGEQISRMAAVDTADGAARISVTVALQNSEARELQAAGFATQAQIGNLVTLEVDADRLTALAALPSVSKIFAAGIRHPLNDRARESIGIDSNSQRVVTQTGRGVVVGIIDTGIDFRHLDFTVPGSSGHQTRIKALLDMTVYSGQSSDPNWNYSLPGQSAPIGRLYSQAEINSALQIAKPADQNQDSIKQRDKSGHGTHVAATAAGNGLASPTPGTYAGMAPEADLIIVKSSRENDGNDEFSTTDVINGIEFVRQKAAELGEPFVINLSLGGQAGPHDGTNPDERAIDALVNGGTGRAVCVAAGNDGGSSIHARSTVPAGGSQTLDFNINGGAQFVDLYQASSDRFSVTITSPDGVTLGPVAYDANGFSQPNGQASNQYLEVFNANDDKGDADPSNDQPDIFVLFSPAAPNGMWKIQLQDADSQPNQPYDAWSGGEGVYFSTYMDLSHLVASPGTARGAITVGAYVTRSATQTIGAGASFTSPGPTADGRQKPEISAPGYYLYSARSADVTDPNFGSIGAGSDAPTDSTHYTGLAGTSMATPVATGAVALLLQSNRGLGASQTKDLLTTYAVKDVFTGSAWAPQLGFGKLNIANSINRNGGGLSKYTIQGRLADPDGRGIVSLQVFLSGTSGAMAITDADGGFRFPNLSAGGNYVVSLGFFGGLMTFTPESYTFNNLRANQTANFTRTATQVYGISGRIIDANGMGIPGVSVELPGSTVSPTSTDYQGYYVWTSVPKNKDYTVTPSTPLLSFTPASVSFPNLSANQVANFSGAPAIVDVKGRVTDGTKGLQGVSVRIDKNGGGDTKTAVTDTDGYYTFNSLVAGNLYTFTASKTGYVFTPASQFLSIYRGMQPNPFIGVANNPIDGQQFFVREHYLDFLGREPDQSGWDFWTSQITTCGTNAACTEVRRINVSASFFLSIEFQQTGYLVERMYKTAFGEATGISTFNGSHQLSVPIVRLSEFSTGTQRIGQGVIVLQPGWEQLLESNKQAFAQEFVQTSRFTTAFPTTMTPTAFVAKLDENAGSVLSASERTAAINLFAGAADSNNVSARAQALRQVAEDPDLVNSEFNRAFVLMQYFGYLRRNPNDPQDTDYTGYDFWLTKLNQFNGNYINAEMVKAFLSSIEYRQRFGP